MAAQVEDEDEMTVFADLPSAEGSGNAKVRQKPRKTVKVGKDEGPATSLSLAFKDLTATVMGGKVLVNNVSGYVAAGDLLMVLGPSGCGKSKFELN
jgi:ABC-type uncharacterized transport system fused permease/ATPase subunit